MRHQFFTYPYLVTLAVLLGLAPFWPEPHLVEKSRMLLVGTLHRPIDIFDLCWHALPLILLGGKIGIDLGHACLGRSEE